MTGVIIATIIIGGLFLIFRLTSRGMERRLTELYRDRTSPEAQVRAPCYVREFHLEEPAVAQVMNGELSVFTLTGKEIRVPLAQVRLTKTRRNKCLLGRHPWWGKTCFWLETPKTDGLVLGVDHPEPWLAVLRAV